MSVIENNKAVSFTYSMTDASGKLLEQSDVPVDYVHGLNSGLLPKVEQTLAGKQVGDKVEITITPDDGFGRPDPNLIFSDSIDNVPPEYRKVGAEAQFKNDAGEIKTFVVTKVTRKKVIMDGNHPYAGKTLVFHVTIIDVRDATADEIASARFETVSQTVH